LSGIFFDGDGVKWYDIPGKTGGSKNNSDTKQDDILFWPAKKISNGEEANGLTDGNGK
jgi:hypothetical protein